MKFIRTAVLTLLLVPSFVLAHPAEDLVRKVTTDLINILESPEAKDDEEFVRSKIQSDVLPHIDFVTMTKITLGATAWKTGTKDQHTELVSQFRQLLLNTYVSALNQYSGQKLQILPYKAGKNDDRIAEVKTLFNDASVRYPIDYKVKNSKADPDKWQVYDIEVENVSLVKSYKAEFTSEIQNGGFDGLIKKLSDKNASSR